MTETQSYTIIPITLEDLRLLVRREMEDALETHLNTEEELLPIKEVAKKIGVSTQTLNAWCRAGRLIRYKIPGSSFTRLNINDVRAAFKEVWPYQKIKL